jgi:hypothetical protein
MKRKFVASVIVALLVGFVGGFGVEYSIYYPQNQSLQRELDNLYANFETINSTLASLQNKLHLLNSDVGDLDSTLEILNATLAGLKSEVENLPAIATFVVNTDGIEVWATRHDGKLQFSGTDAAAVIQQAINDLTPNRTWKEKVVVNGNFVLTDTVKLPSFVTLEIVGTLHLADGANKTMISNSDPKTGNKDIDVIIDGTLDGNKANQAAILIDVIEFVGGDNIASTCRNIKVLNGRVINGKRYGIRFVNVQDSVIGFNWVENCDTAIDIVSCLTTLPVLNSGNLVIGNTVYNNTVDGLSFACGYGNKAIGNTSRKNGGAGIIIDSGEGSLIQGNYIEENQQNGIYVGTYVSKRPDKNRFIGNYVFNNNQNGLFLVEGEKTLISSNVFEANGQARNNTYSDIKVRTKYNEIVMNECLAPWNATHTPKNAKTKYGIEEETGADFNIIKENRVEGQASGAIYTVGLNTQLQANEGYLTENSGTATVANCEWIPHGLAIVPAEILVTTRTATYGSPPVAVVVGWINQNATHFQVSAYWTNSTAITNDAIDISWYAEG